MRNSKWSIVNGQWFAFKSLKRIFLHLASYILFIHVSAQSVSASLDRDKILLGEQVTLQFTLSNINEATSFVASWPQLKDTSAHTEILKRNAIDTITVNGANTYQQNFTLTSFDSGNWQLGPFLFIIQDKVSGRQTQLITQPVFLTVLSVDVSSLKEYHPIKDIIDVENSFNWTPVIIAAIIILLVIIIFILIKKRKNKIAVKPKIILKGTPLERALEKLLALQKESLISGEAIKKFHSETDFIIRKYFEEIMQINALQLTSFELFSRLNVYMQNLQLRSKFQQLFELNGAVKFAKYLPTAAESKNALNEIIISLQQVDESVNQAKINADRLV